MHYTVLSASKSKCKINGCCYYRHLYCFSWGQRQAWSRRRIREGQREFQGMDRHCPPFIRENSFYVLRAHGQVLSWGWGPDILLIRLQNMRLRTLPGTAQPWVLRYIVFSYPSTPSLIWTLTGNYYFTNGNSSHKHYYYVVLMYYIINVNKIILLF